MELLDEIRVRAQKKREEVLRDYPDNPDKIRFADMTVKFFSNQDYISGSKEFVVSRLLYYLGYPMTELRDVYDRLLKEINRSYPVVSPEMLAKLLEEKKADHPKEE